jgi:hypothetical protein
MNNKIIDDDFIKGNNVLILSQCLVKPRYGPEKKPQENSGKESVSEKPNERNKPNDFHKRLLYAVYKGQYEKTITEVCKDADFPAGTGSRIAEEYVKKNYIKNIQVPFGRGRPKYPVLLSDGYKLIGLQEKKFYGRGAGYEHILYQHLISNHFQDFKPVIELNRNEKFIDVAIETNEFLFCFEVAMTSVHEKENIEKDLIDAKSDFVIVACLNEKVLKEVQKIISEFSNEIQSKTQAILISELLKINPDEFIHNLQLKKESVQCQLIL